MAVALSKEELNNIIAERVAKELQNGDVVNLGIGVPTLVADYVPSDIDVTLHSENGILNLGGSPAEDQVDPNIINAGGQPASVDVGGAFLHSADSFGLVRGGHVDITVLGALQVDEKGNIANYKIPGKYVPGMGGAMDLVAGAKRVIVAMEHTNKGNHKILRQCTLPLTGEGRVSLIVTEMGVFEPTERGLVVVETNPDFTNEEIQEATEAELIFE